MRDRVAAPQIFFASPLLLLPPSLPLLPQPALPLLLLPPPLPLLPQPALPPSSCCCCCQVGRRYKIMNPERMRGTYGLLMYLLMDSQIPEVQASREGGGETRELTKRRRERMRGLVSDSAAGSGSPRPPRATSSYINTPLTTCLATSVLTSPCPLTTCLPTSVLTSPCPLTTCLATSPLRTCSSSSASGRCGPFTHSWRSGAAWRCWQTRCWRPQRQRSRTAAGSATSSRWTSRGRRGRAHFHSHSHSHLRSLHSLAARHAPLPPNYTHASTFPAATCLPHRALLAAYRPPCCCCCCIPTSLLLLLLHTDLPAVVSACPSPLNTPAAVQGRRRPGRSWRASTAPAG